VQAVLFLFDCVFPLAHPSESSSGNGVSGTRHRSGGMYPGRNANDVGDVGQPASCNRSPFGLACHS